MATKCPATAANGSPCRASVAAGAEHCRWHDPSPAAREKVRAEGSKGGLTKAYGQLVATSPLSEDPNVAGLDLSAAEGLRGFLAAALRALARLPFDVRAANSIAQVVTAQRGVVEAHDFERRLTELEKAAEGKQRLRAV